MDGEWIVRAAEHSGLDPRVRDIVVLEDVYEQFRVRIHEINPDGTVFMGVVMDPTRHGQPYSAGTLVAFQRRHIQRAFQSRL